jgi:redox-sensing transcriptional repressor
MFYTANAITRGRFDVRGEIPDIVIGRLPIYLRALSHLAADGQKLTTSSHELGSRLGISSAQIRKDLSHFGEFGKQGTGYNINYLIDQLRHILNLDHEWPVAVIGAGYLGHALAHYRGFWQRGFRICWIFDNDEEKVGQEMNGIRVQPLSEMAETIKKGGGQIAILAVPTESAQEIADLLVETGINAILSYAPINLTVPAGVHVQYSDPVVQMQRMTFYLEPEDQ